MYHGAALTRLLGTCIHGLGIARRMYNTLGWKAHGDDGADVDVALQIQGAAVQFDEGLGERKAETGALVLAVQIAVDLAETRERLGNVLRRDADAGIDDLEHVAAVRPTPDPERHLAAMIGELDCVGEQVDQDLLQLAFIGAQGQ